MEYLLENLEWLKDNFDNYSDDEYMILDCPGQVTGPCLFSKTQFLYCVHIFLHYCHGFWVLQINIQYIDVCCKVELYSHVPVMRTLVECLQTWGLKICGCYLIDATYAAVRFELS
jgi:hypothetical protein